MEKNEVFDKVLEHLKSYYDSGNRSLVYIPGFIENLCGEDKHSDYICEKLGLLKIVTQQKNPDRSNYKWTVCLNAEGSDWMDRHGSWSEFQEAQNAEEKHGVKITPRNVEILNRLFLLKINNKQNYYDSLQELIKENNTKKYEHFICCELSWVNGYYIDGRYMFNGIEDDDALDHFLSSGMFNYLLDVDVNVSQQIPSLNLTINAKNVNISIITEALTATLNPEQIAELKKVSETAKNDQDRKTKIINKLGSFGQGVAEKVLANILSKGETWQAIGQGLDNLI